MSTPAQVQRTFSAPSFPLFLLLVIATVAFAAGCGSGGGLSQQSTPAFSGNTSVTLLLSSTANDQLSRFDLGFTGITLTNQAGTTVPLLSEPQNSSLGAEFIHVNGGIDPLLTVSVPQGIYTSASLQFGGGALFTCVTQTPATSQDPGSLDVSMYAYGYVPDNMVSVDLPSPITITGDSMGLLLNLLVSQSATYSFCYNPNAISTYSITPTLSVTSLSVSSNPTNAADGKVTDLNGQVAAIGAADNFTLALTEGPRNLTISANSGTVYQGIGGFSALTVGTFVNMDGAIQPDGSLLATRIGVEDPSASDVLIGPVLQVSPNQPAVNQPVALFFNQESQGRDPIADAWQYSISNSLLQISGELNNLQSLPFAASFNATNIVAGQRAYVSSSMIALSDAIWTPATTVTLLPQTVDGTVMGSSTVGAFTVYETALASYDLFPTLAMQPEQVSVLANPDTVEVYVDNNTQTLNSQPIAAGNTLRFYGLVFNDNGTLRMDCAQVNDGVSFTPPVSSSQERSLEAGAELEMQRELLGGRVQSIRVLKQQP